MQEVGIPHEDRISVLPYRPQSSRHYGVQRIYTKVRRYYLSARVIHLTTNQLNIYVNKMRFSNAAAT